MKRWKLAAIVCAVVACLCLTLTACGAGSEKPALKEQTVPASALGTSNTLRVGVNSSLVPLAGKNGDEIVGIDAEVAYYIGDQLGLKVTLVDIGSEAESALNDGRVDIALGVEASDAEDASFWRSDTYLATGVALFGTANESAVPTLDSAPKIAAQTNSKSSWRVTNLYGDSALVAQDSLKAAFDAMNSGAARYTAADAIIGTFAANVSNDYNDKIVALLQDPSGYCVGVKSTNTDLQEAVKGVVSNMKSGGIIDIIEAKWLGAPLKLDSVTVVKSGAADATASTGTSGATATDATATGSTDSASTATNATATGSTDSASAASASASSASASASSASAATN